MIEIEASGKIIQLYKSAEELPIKRYSKFQKYNLIESGLGSDLESIGTHLHKLFEYHAHGMLEQASQEAKNLYYNFFTVLEEIPVPGLAFACLVHSIDGNPILDVSEDNLVKVVEQLDSLGVTRATVDEYILNVKKKSSLN